MKVLITGIGCIGKSSLRERVDSEFPDKVILVDMDYDKQIPSDEGKVIIVESVHGLENNPESFDRILYLLPPRWYIILWLRRAWAWFSTGIVDLSAPKGTRKRFAISNIPIILKILMRNITWGKRWIRTDIALLQRELYGKNCIAPSIDHDYRAVELWIKRHIN